MDVITYLRLNADAGLANHLRDDEGCGLIQWSFGTYLLKIQSVQKIVWKCRLQNGGQFAYAYVKCVSCTSTSRVSWYVTLQVWNVAINIL